MAKGIKIKVRLKNKETTGAVVSLCRGILNLCLRKVPCKICQSYLYLFSNDSQICDNA